MPKLRLPARPGHVRHEATLIVQLGERGGRVKRGFHRGARVVRLVEHGEQDLAVCVDVAAWVFVVVRDGVSVQSAARRRAEEREDVRGSEEVFHQDGWELDKVGRAARAGYVLVFRAADHGCEGQTNKKVKKTS